MDRGDVEEVNLCISYYLPMNILKIAIGTKSNYKVNAIKKVLYEMDLDFDAVFDKADSGVSDQPQKEGETRQGSINRAVNILKQYPDSDFGIGVEFGYEPIDGKYHMICYASIATKDNKVFTEASSTLELAKPLINALHTGVDVDDTFDLILDKLSTDEVSRKYLDFIKKRKVIYECLENVLLRYVFDEAMY